MYKFYYDHLKVKYPDRCSLLFTVTDSLCCEIQTDDLYSDMGASLHHYDTSNFAQDHPQYSTTNRRVLGKFNSETGSDAPSEFVGLRAKMYSLYVPRTLTKCHKKSQRHSETLRSKSCSTSAFCRGPEECTEYNNEYVSNIQVDESRRQYRGNN